MSQSQHPLQPYNAQLAEAIRILRRTYATVHEPTLLLTQMFQTQSHSFFDWAARNTDATAHDFAMHLCSHAGVIPIVTHLELSASRKDAYQYALMLNNKTLETGWVPLYRVGFGLILGHFIATAPETDYPPDIIQKVYIDQETYTTLKEQFNTFRQEQRIQQRPELLEELLNDLTQSDTYVNFVSLLYGEHTPMVQEIQRRRNQPLEQLDLEFATWLKFHSAAALAADEFFSVVTAKVVMGYTNHELTPLLAPETTIFERNNPAWVDTFNAIPVYASDKAIVIGSTAPDQTDLHAAVRTTFPNHSLFFCYLSDTSYQFYKSQYNNLQVEAKARTKLPSEEDDLTPNIAFDGQEVEVQSQEQVQMQEADWTIDFVNRMLAHAVAKRATDLHIEPVGTQFRIRLRVDGLLIEPHKRFPIHFCYNVVRRIKALASMNTSETRVGLDGRFKLTLPGKRTVDIRVASSPIETPTGDDQLEKIILRLLDGNTQTYELNTVINYRQQYETVVSKLTRPNGLLIVTGPTGSGKSTTLYSMLSHVNDPSKNIVTAEDPVERRIPGVNQTPIRPPNTFAGAIRNFLRSDPDIILVGEIRDEETANLAIRASQTGHLVLTTIHANTGLAVVNRLGQLGIKAYDISASLELVIAQRLIRQLCLCRQKSSLSVNERELFSQQQIQSTYLDENYVYKHNGCNVCDKTGYSKRFAIFEVLGITTEIRSIVEKYANDSRELVAAAQAAGYKNMYHYGLRSVAEGRTDIDELNRCLVDVYY